jgi:hypothetical protein
VSTSTTSVLLLPDVTHLIAHVRRLTTAELAESADILASFGSDALPRTSHTARLAASLQLHLAHGDAILARNQRQ